MHSQDYERIAEMLSGELRLAEVSVRGFSDEEQRLGYARRTTVVRITLSLADIFKQDNANFDRERFYAAVGIEDHGEGYFKVTP